MPAFSLIFLMRNTFLRRVSRRLLLPLLLPLGSLSTLAQPTVTGLSPTRNLRNAPPATNVALTFSQAISAGTADNIRVFSQQRGGQLVRPGGGTVSGGGTNTITFDPANNFRPGETVFVTVPTSVQSTGGQAAVKHTYQFTAGVNATSSGTFRSGGDPGVGSNPGSVAPADVDGDGDLDLLVASFFDNAVIVGFNDGGANFNFAGSVATDNLPTRVVAGDLDADGDLDLLTANYSANTVSVRLNDGTGTFSGTQNMPVGTTPQYVKVADLDGDGDLDFVTSNSGSNNLSVGFNNGTGTFSAGPTLAVGLTPIGVAAGDIDGDGDLDLLATNDDDGFVSVRLNNGSGAFTTAPDVPVIFFGYRDPQLADVDGDGDLDLLTVTNRGNTLSVRLNNGAGTFSGGSDLGIGAAIDMTTGDVDGDGDLDALMANFVNGNGTVSVRLNNGAGVFSGTTEVGVGGGPREVVAADLDGDGALDFVVPNSNGSNSVSIRLNSAGLVLTSLSPNSGAVGASVILTGTLFNPATAVRFNGTAASFTVNSNTQITAIVPAGATSGDVTVTSPAGTTNGVAFTVTVATAAPVVTAPADGSYVNTPVPTYSGTAPAGSTVTVYVDGAATSSTTAAADGSFSLTNFMTVLSMGAHTVYATAQSSGQAVSANSATNTFTVDTSPPQSIIFSPPVSGVPNGGSTSNSSVPFNVFFNEPVTGFSAAGVSVSNGSVSGFSGSGTTYYFNVVPAAGGTVSVFVLANAAQDAAGLSNPGSGPYSFTYNAPVTAAPVVTAPADGSTVSTPTPTYAGTAVAGSTVEVFVDNGSIGTTTATVSGSFSLTQPTVLSYAAHTVYATAQASGATVSANSTTNTFTIALSDLTVSGVQTVPAGTYRNLTVTGTGIATLGGAVQATGAVLVQGTLNTACQPLTGAGTFTLAAGATLSICDAAGISSSGATGAVQVTGARSFASDATYIYASGVSQITGLGLPTQVRGLTKQGTGVLVLSQAVAVTEVLRLEGGTLNSGDQALTLLSNATRTAYAVHQGGTTSGNVTVQRYVGGPAALGYRHLASPVQATTVADLTTSGYTPFVNPAYNALPTPSLTFAQFPKIFGYDEARTNNPTYAAFGYGYYSPASLGSTLTSGRGWDVLMNGGLTPDFVGALTNGNVPLNLTVTGTNTSPNTQKAGWHLLGNAYAQPIDWDLATIPTGMSSSISVYRTTGGSNGLYLTWVAGGTGTLPNGVVPLGQGFFARATAATTFTFTNAMRVEANPGTVARPRLDTRPTLRLRLTSTVPGSAVVETILYTQPGATLGEDLRFDGLRPGRNMGTVPTLASLISGQEAAVNALPETVLTGATETVVELTAVLPEVGTYTLAVTGLANFGATPVTLLDRLTGTRYDLAQQPVLTLTATRANEEMTGRFAVVLNGQRVTGTTAPAALAAFLTIFPNPALAGKVVNVSGAVPAGALVLSDLAGRQVATVKADATGAATLPISGLAAGVYVLRTADGRTTRLVVE